MDNKNSPPCQEKNKENYFFFFDVAFLVVFLVLGCFIPHDIVFSPPYPIVLIYLYLLI